MSADSLDELRAQRLRQRLWGATIIIALAVIFLPLLLDGSGSESQFRRVERLREEPPRVINIDGSRETVPVPSSDGVDRDSWWQRTKKRFQETPSGDSRDARRAPDTEATETTTLTIPDEATDGVDDVELPAITQTTDVRAWVVQAGSFREEANAVAVRDRLRRAGYPSFVTLSDDGTVFRVRVGPMINNDQATVVQKNVMELLGRDAIVLPYP